MVYPERAEEKGHHPFRETVNKLLRLFDFAEVNLREDSPNVLLKAGSHVRAEGSAGPRHDHTHRLHLGKRGLVDAGVEKGVEGVRHTHYLHPRCDLVPGQAVRVAAAVPSFVVVAAHIAQQGEVIATGKLRVFQ